MPDAGFIAILVICGIAAVLIYLMTLEQKINEVLRQISNKEKDGG